ncbi:hypothetical protein FLLO111716_08020 [Flavobacterium longum]|uniref:hypothetical protein n=1 Tax=Flavobacterium longum TaxID=1299340 RepID=UPI0039E8BA3A
MKTIKSINNWALGLPMGLGVLGIIWPGFFILALLSTTLTGLLQVVAAICFWGDYPENRHIKIYFAGVLLFFLLLSALPDGTEWIWLMPILLCVYLCIIIYTQKDLPNETD